MVIVAERMFELDHVYCATGARTHLLQLPVGEIKKLLEENECEVKIADITEQVKKFSPSKFLTSKLLVCSEKQNFYASRIF